MYWIALTLGFFGSMHCIGMCGPLAYAVLSSKNQDGFYGLWSAITYNFGRISGYVTLGIIFGLVGSIATFGGMQKILSIVLGIILLLLSLFAINPDQLISKNRVLKTIMNYVSNGLHGLLQKSKTVPPIFLGAVNGFLPCGLVYIAIAGAMTLSNIWGAMGFMLFFGLGTLPAMIIVALGPKVIHPYVRVSLKKLYPVISFLMGVYLIYRGLMSKMPLELDFFAAIKNPVMCH